MKDPDGDFYQVSKKGSHILRHIREQQNRAAMREKFWELSSNTRLGSLLKINKEADRMENSIQPLGQKILENSAGVSEEDIDYKTDS